MAHRLSGDYHLAGFTAATLDNHLRKAGLRICEASILYGWLYELRTCKISRPITHTKFVHAAYFSILGRPADPVGLATYSNALAESHMTREEAEAEILNSDEANFLRKYPAYLWPYAPHIEK